MLNKIIQEYKDTVLSVLLDMIDICNYFYTLYTRKTTFWLKVSYVITSLLYFLSCQLVGLFLVVYYTIVAVLDLVIILINAIVPPFITLLIVPFCKYIYNKVIDVYTAKKKAKDIPQCNYDAVAEVMCKILRDNASTIGIVSPNTVMDITPTKYPRIRYIKGVPIVHIIAQRSSTMMSSDSFLELLNIKLEQELHCFMTTYNPAYVGTLYVISVNSDMYYGGYYSIQIAVTFDDATYQMIKDGTSPINNNTSANSSTPHQCDKDF